jgi:hypothetical protein
MTFDPTRPFRVTRQGPRLVAGAPNPMDCRRRTTLGHPLLLLPLLLPKLPEPLFLPFPLPLPLPPVLGLGAGRGGAA